MKHFKFIGTTGTGKSTAIRELLEAALRRGDRAVIADPDGGYLRRFYDPRARRRDPQSLRAGFRAAGTCSQRSAMPTTSSSWRARSFRITKGPDRSWRGYARTFFSAVTAQAHAAGSRDVRELYRLLVVAGTAGAADPGGRHAGAAVSRRAQRPHVRLDPLGHQLRRRRARLRRAADQRAAVGAPVGAQGAAPEPAVARRRAVHALPGRADRGAALDDLRVDAAGDLRGDGNARRGTSGCGSWSMSWMRSGRSTG